MAMQQTHMYNGGNRVSARVSIDVVSREIAACRACDNRGYCVAQRLLESSGQAELVSNNSRCLKRGEHVYREGNEATALYVVRSGAVKSYLITPEGDEQVLGFYMAGDVLGLDGMGGRGRLSSAVVLETASICRIPTARLSGRGRSHDILELVSEQMARDHNLVFMLARKDADSRVASFLCDLSCRFDQHGYSASEFNLSMSRQDIGSYLGLAVETVSRTLTRFQEAGVLVVSRRKIEVGDVDKLLAIAGAQALH